MKITKKILRQLIIAAFYQGVDSRHNADRQSDIIRDRKCCADDLMDVAERYSK